MATSRGRPNAGPGRKGKQAPGRPQTRAGATSRPAAGAPVREVTPSSRRQPAQVWRMIVVVTLMAFIALFLAPTLRGYLDQRAEISRAEQEIRDEEQRIADIHAELEAWQDPKYVERQARERLRFVLPDQAVFAVLDDTGDQLTEALPGMAPVTVEVHTHRPWYGEVWESVVVANEGLPDGAGD